MLNLPMMQCAVNCSIPISWRFHTCHNPPWSAVICKIWDNSRLIAFFANIPIKVAMPSWFHEMIEWSWCHTEPAFMIKMDASHEKSVSNLFLIQRKKTYSSQIRRWRIILISSKSQSQSQSQIPWRRRIPLAKSIVGSVCWMQENKIYLQ